VSPTPTRDLADRIVCLSRCDAYGLYHATSENNCSWYEFAREIFSLAGVQAKLEVASPREFPAKTPRPAYSVLENRGLNKKDRLEYFCFLGGRVATLPYANRPASCRDTIGIAF